MNGILDLADPTVPAATDCVVATMLAARASATPDQLFLESEDGMTWTYEQMHAAMRRTASALHELGLRRGDRLICWLPNGAGGVRLFLAASYLGATFVGLNTAYRGTLLDHAFALTRPKLAVVHRSLADRLSPTTRRSIPTVIEVGNEGTDNSGWELLDSLVPPAEDGVTTEPWDVAAIVFTSGTTGPSKAVLSSWVHQYTWATSQQTDMFRAGDRVLYIAPLFHQTGILAIVQAIMRDYTLVQTSGFRTETFWDVIRARRISAAYLTAPMLSFLLHTGDDLRREHPLRRVITSPLTADAIAFGQRAGVTIYTGFGMSEIVAVLASGPNPTTVGSCGRVQPGFDARLVDAADREVAQGEVGELILRPTRPWAFSHGYDNNPDATAAAWRNGWFHTGDAFRQDELGDFFFVDRVKDAIRRRGENISSFELERAVEACKGVARAAAVAVASDIGDDEVLVAVVPESTAPISPADLIRELQERLPYFMVPRYVRVVDQLPVNASDRVQKHLLRADGVTAETWDREAAGIEVRRERFS